MTQDEVDKIYEYLHDNYEYRGGELLVNKNYHGKNKGEKLGFITNDKNGNILVKCRILINGKAFNIKLSFLIWIYFNKTHPKYLSYKDKNPVNCRIENLISLSRVNINTFSTDHDNKNIHFHLGKFNVALKEKGILYHFGRFDKKEDARLLRDKMFKLHIEEGLSIAYLHKTFSIKHSSRKTCGIGRSGKSTFYARITKGKERIYLGTFKTPEEAHEAYLKAKGVSHDSR